ncbi:Cerato-ulmin hydrophobin family [Echria macrotheca]|uniref:Cerato-ulmin hydrophobin family n=1 Tax=Echria macrotheca TaxID=438768 RepID=A0AAJ0F6A4_9PEZI|nr:Cerato-ulmin hydrophobin family [Echria macrotheca]
MKLAATILVFVTAALAIPTGGPSHGGGHGGGSGGGSGGGGGGGGGASYDPCSGLYNTAQCCATDVLGVADLDCAQPPSVPRSASSFSSICAGIGQRARCCVLPVLGQAVLCETPAGVKG